VRDYIHVVDLAQAHLKALEYSRSQKGAEVFNIGTGRGYSVLEMINAFSEASGRNIAYEIVGRRPGDIAKCLADSARAESVLGWKTKLGLVEMSWGVVCTTQLHGKQGAS
jgi:UDP-glucose 4-epimerase